MALKKVRYINNQTVITAENMNAMQDAIVEAEANIGKHSAQIADEITARENADATEKAERKAEIAVERERINALSTLQEGSTTGDAELLDARTDRDAKTWPNVGAHIRGITNKIIEACCDTKYIETENYNLLKISEVSYSSRLQDADEEIVTSTAANAVTGWFPIEYGKYYALSVLYNGSRVSMVINGTTWITRRIQIKLTDGSIVYHNLTSNDYSLISYNGDAKAVQIPYENATEMRIHIGIGTDDISTAEKLEAYELMIVEGNTVAEAYDNSVNLAYIDGDAEIPVECEYFLKRDAEIINARTDCENNAWPNVGEHIRGITKKIIEACCDTEIVGGNYNILKISECTYSSRLQNDVEGMTSSTNSNLVTGWIPVQYGKFYTPSILYNGERITGSSNFSIIPRINLLLDNGDIVVYNNTYEDRAKILYAPNNNETIVPPYENAVAVMLQWYILDSNIGTAELFESYEPMVVEGDSVTAATTKSTTFEYLNGDEEVPAEVVYKLKSEETKADKLSASPYYRNVNFGVLPFAYYKGVADSYENSVFGWTTQYTDFIALWKSLIASHSGYVTETALGPASDGQTVYLYDFKPVRMSNQDKSIPKIIIIAGQHGGETANIFGMYFFVNNLLNKWNEHPALEYLRNNVELLIIPVLNTYGFDNRSYKNANGVNLNRNYDSNWALLEDTTSSQYGGAEPFDQPETQIVRDLLLSNLDAVMVVDSHVNGGGKVANYSDINYYGISTSTDEYFNRMVDAVAHNLSAVSANFNLDYELEHPDTIMGFLNHNDGTGILRNWGRDQNLVTVLVEGFGGFPNRTAYAAEVFKANEEILVNWLITAMNYLSK